MLPGFEFTATFGFHILGIFPPGTSLRKLELLLLKLDVPEQKMLAGAPDAGATSDVIEAYEAIAEAGGLPIAAHANSSNGVAMQGFNFGGQTKIAYTQHPALAALEVTDLDQTGRRTTESFFNGSKPEYPRRMHCIQGSDAHSWRRSRARAEQAPRRGRPLHRNAAARHHLRGDARPVRQQRVRPHPALPPRPGRAPTTSCARRARRGRPSCRRSMSEPPARRAAPGPSSRTWPPSPTPAAARSMSASAPDETVPVRGVDSIDETINMLRFDIQRSIVPPLDVTFTTAYQRRAQGAAGAGAAGRRPALYV